MKYTTLMCNENNVFPLSIEITSMSLMIVKAGCKFGKLNLHPKNYLVGQQVLIIHIRLT